ncbi:hypothetical protein LDENG_00279470 [Lucifuga dentata]|nr:hypothetical protein LDENG_00279470 [Lucifuga dentata]
MDLGLILGTEYDRKKQKLQQELRLDFNHYIAKKKDLKTSVFNLQPQSLSLPTDERKSVKEKLREKRNEEDTFFLKKQPQTTRLKWGPPYIAEKPGQVQDTDASHISSPPSPLHFQNTQPNRHQNHREHSASRRDAATLSEAAGTRKSSGARGQGHQDHQGQRNLDPHRLEEPYNSEEELHTDKEEEWEFSGRAAEENAATQMRKEQYKQELLKQIDEHRKNKMKEKKLELRVAATGAIDPEKKPDRLKQFGVVNRHYDNWRRDVPYKPGIDLDALGNNPNPRLPRDDKPAESTDDSNPPGKSQVAFLSPAVDFSTAASQQSGKKVPGSGTGASSGIPSLALFNEDYHRNLSNTLGEMPVPSATGKHGTSLLAGGMLPADRSKQARERALSYQEALRQQIKEREELKRRQREERERYDAQIEAEMMAYNPWGRSGGGAPIKDKGGNLISDLNQMHRTNEEVYRNHGSRDITRAQSFVARNFPIPGADPQITGSHDQPTSQQLHKQDSYKDILKRQIEENRQKLAEERERIKKEEEKEEKRLAEQRARIRQEYEEEQKKLEKRKNEQQLKNEWLKNQRLENQTLNREHAHQEEERRKREEQEIQKKVTESYRGREERQEQREPSPPIPALQKKSQNHLASRPSTVVSPLSPKTVSEHSMSAPYSPPVPARRNQLRDKSDQQEVFRKLSALRKNLQKKKRELEDQLGQRDQDKTHSPLPSRHRRRPKVNPCDFTKKPADQTSPRRPLSCVNTQNIKEFNQLKNRDTASREEVRHMYPDPPSDAQSLDIQQQALLRQQQHAMRRMKREEDHDSLLQQLNYHHPRTKPARNSKREILPSETTFIDVYGGDAPEQLVPKESSRQPTAEDQDSRVLQKRDDHDEVAIPIERRERDVQSDAESLQSAICLNVKDNLRADKQHRITADQVSRDHSCRSEACVMDEPLNSPETMSGNEVDAFSLCSSHSVPERRVSVETVATEAWLRPGTSDAVRRQDCKERLSRGMDRPSWLMHRVI